MTKPNFTSINVILDASGSMGKTKNDTIGGYNSFLHDQKELPGEAIWSLTTFNTYAKLEHDCLSLASVPPLTDKTYQTRGNTALLDAVGLTIDNVGKKLASMKEEDRPSKVLFVILTDGEENCSSLMEEDTESEFSVAVGATVVSGIKAFNLLGKLKYTKERVKEMIEHQQTKYNWCFAFLGAGIDAFHSGQSLGINTTNTLSFNADANGISTAYNTVSKSAQRYRSGNGGSSGFFGG